MAMASIPVNNNQQQDEVPCGTEPLLFISIDEEVLVLHQLTRPARQQQQQQQAAIYANEGGYERGYSMYRIRYTSSEQIHRIYQLALSGFPPPPTRFTRRGRQHSLSCWVTASWLCWER
mmetsp:Transcript_75933/g.203427  ORF Transcript_75933/g.203427 Transcript_75933/m.203427 type:complete len:119 (+) Transcript_75933:373-729(+)